MKKLFLLLAAAVLFAACSSTKEVDDDPIEPPTPEATLRLEALCEQLNSDLATLHTLIAADELPDCVVNVAPIVPDGETIGYGFAFKQNGPVTFYLDRNEAVQKFVPQFGVYETDGIRYWSMNGKPLPTATGAPAPVLCEAGVAPRLKAEKGYWYVSVDDGASWWPAGLAPDGTTELATAPLVSQVSEESDAWTITLAGDSKTTLSIPKEGTLSIAVVVEEELKFQPNEIHTVHYTVTGGGSKTVVTSELENPDGSYNVEVTPIDMLTGTVAITADVPAINKVFITAMDGSRTATATVAVTLRPVLTEKMVTVITPGTLAELLADYDQVAITELTITGYLNEDDFRTLNDLPNLAVLDLENVNLKTLPQKAFARGYNEPATTLISIKLPKNLVEIGEKAFYECSSLTSVTLPEGVTTIGDNAFYGCSGLTSITLPEGVTEIGYFAFGYCCNLIDIVIPESITVIKSDTFRYCTALKSVTIPKSVTKIGTAAFYGCSALTDVTLPEGITEIDGYLFYKCSSLTSINIPDSVTLILNNAFQGCKLTSITIPANVTRIAEWAFCSLSEVYCKAQVPPRIDEYKTFINWKTLYVPVGSAEAYKEAAGWKQFWEIIEMEF